MKLIKRTLAVFLVMIMLVTSAPLGGFVGVQLPELSELFATKAAAAMSLSSYNVGDIIEYGSYPQTRVTDSGLISQLEAKSSSWKSYGYMSGAGTSEYDGSAQPSDYMQYRDVKLKDGSKYRAVKFTTYRPWYTNYESTTSTNATYQAANGYYINNTYWFKFEPLDWRVLDPALGLVLCESIIDSQPYSNTVYYLNYEYRKDSAGTIYANNYAESSIRAWLNYDFYYTAFSDSEQSNITKATIDNKAYDSSYSEYNSATTSDKVFLLSYDDIFKPEYGFGSYDINRRAAGTDYAKCQGLHTYTDLSYYTTPDGKATSMWWLRSAGNGSNHASSVDHSGYAFTYCHESDVGITIRGARPALILNPQSSVNLSTNKKSALSNGQVQFVFYDKNNETLIKNQKLKINGTEYKTDKDGTVTATVGSGEIKIEKSGYNNYVFSSDFINGNLKTIYLQQNTTKTEPYVSSVHVKNSNSDAWFDVGNTSLNVRNDASAKYDVSVYVEWNGYTRNDEDEFVYLAQKSGKSLSHELNGNSYTWNDVVLSENFNPNANIYAYCVGYKKKNKKEFLTSGTYSTKLIIDKATPSWTDERGISILGNGLSWTIDDDVPIIGGGEISLGSLSLPVTIDIDDDNKFKIAVGFGTKSKGVSGNNQGDKTISNSYDIFGFGSSTSNKTDKDGKATNKTESTNKWNAFKNTVDDLNSMKDKKALADKLKKQSKKWGNNKKLSFWGVTGTVSACGYIEGFITDAGWVFTAVNIQAGFAVDASWTKQFIIAPIPVPFYIKAGLNGGIDIEASWDRQAAGVVSQTVSDWNFDIALHPNIKLSFGAGVGVAKCLCVDVDGSGQYICDIKFVDKTITNNVTLAATFNAQAFLLTYEKTIAEKTWQWTKALGKSKAPLKTKPINDTITDNLNEGIYDEENYTELASRDYLESMKWLGENSNPRKAKAVGQKSYSMKTLMTSIYNDSRQQLVEVGSTKMLFWIMDNSERTSQNRTMLVYSKYEPSTDKWSAPVPVCDDGTADFMPDVVSDGERVYITWQNMNKVFGADVSLNDYVESSEIAYAVYDNVTNSISVSSVTNNAVYDAMPQVSVENGNAVVCWIESEDNDAFLKSNVNRINIVDILSGNVRTVAENVSAITSMDMLTENGKAYISYACDEDSNYDDQSDNEVYLLTVNGSNISTKKLSDNDYIDSAPLFAKINGKTMLFRYANNNYVVYDVTTGKETNLFENESFNTDSYTVVTSDSGINYVIWSAKDSVGHVALYTSVYENSKWSEAVQIGVSDSKITNPSAVVEADGSLMIACNNTEQILVDGEEISYYENGKANLAIMTVSQYADLTVTDDSFIFDYTDAVEGKTITVPITLLNSGNTTINSVDVSINSNAVKTATVNLMPGETKEINVDYTFPEITQKSDVIVKVLPTNGDINEGDNEFSFSYGYTDLVVSNCEFTSSGSTGMITAVVENLSTIACGKLTINIREDRPDGDIILSEEYASLEADEIINVAAIIELENVELDKTGKKIFYIEVVTDDEEYSKGNNSEYVYFREENNQGYDYGVLNVLSSETVTVIGYVTNNNFEDVTLNVKAEIFDKNDNRIAYKVKNVEIGAKETYSVNEEFEVNEDVDYAVITIDSECEHIFGDWTITEMSTCTKSGIKEKVCLICAVHATEYIPATNHAKAYSVNGLGATCLEDGYTAGRYCPDCKQYISGHNIINAEGHRDLDGNGICDICSTRISDAHIHSFAINIIKPTCTEKGYTTYTCFCGESYVDDYVNATGHNNVNGRCIECGFDFTNGCSCSCHKKGIAHFFWSIINFFKRIFKKDQFCDCRAKHW